MAANTSQVNVYAYSGGSVTTSAYTTLIASTSISCSSLQISDTSGELLKLAVGVAGSEVDICAVPINAAGAVVKYYLPAGTRVAIKAINSTASTGYNVLGLIPW